MTFNPNVDQMVTEIIEGEKRRDLHCDAVNSIVKRYASRHYAGDGAGVQRQPENIGYAFIVNMLPQLAWDNPAAHVTGSRVPRARIIAQAIEDALDSWLEREQFNETVAQAIAYDFLFFSGFCLTYLDSDERWQKGAVMPKCKRIDFRDFVMDPLAPSFAEAKWMGHSFEVDLDELVDDPEAIPEEVAKLRPVPGMRSDENAKKYGFEKGDASDARKTVTLYSIWIRETNTIRTISCEQPAEVYPPITFYGPPEGPYTECMAHRVPNMPWPLSPLVAIEEQVRDLNLHATVLSRAARRRKKFAIVEANNRDLADKVKTVAEGDIITAKNIRDSMLEVEVGGPSGEMIQQIALLRDRVDRHLGLTETQRGSGGAFDTATEASIAAQASTNRIEFYKRQFRVFTRDVLKKIGWYLFNTEGIIIPIAQQDSYTGEVMQALFFGGPDPLDMGAQWDDFDLTIDVYSQERVDSRTLQMNMLQFIQALETIASLMPAMPWVKWINVLNALAEVYNIADAEQFIYPEIFGAQAAPPATPVAQILGRHPTAPQRGLPGRDITARRQPGRNPLGQVPGMDAANNGAMAPGFENGRAIYGSPRQAG